MRMLANSAIDDAMNKVMDAFKDQGVDLPSNMVRLSAGLTAVAPRLTECPDQVMSQAMREAVEEVRQEEGEVGIVRRTTSAEAGRKILAA